jgi:dTDP-4-amino-4,6-dideoxygalactose transaminase
MQMDDRVYLSAPDVGESEVSRVVAALRSGWVAPLGPEVDGFERDMSAFTGVPFAAALSSGTAAIHLALRAAGVGQGDSAYCPTITFGATAFAITYVGAQPVFLDVEETSWNLDPDVLAMALQADAAAGRLPKAIITVDIFGRTPDYDRIMPIAHQYSIPVIEDAAEALGANHLGQAGITPAGGFGLAGVFSFNGNKIMTTSGGGMLVSKDESLIEKARFWATQSRDPAPWYEHTEIGFNYRMSNILAALGRAQLERLPAMIDRRRSTLGNYQQALGGIQGVQVIGDPPWSRSNAWLTNVRFDPVIHPGAATRVREALELDNIEARPVWKPMHAQPVFADAASHLTGSADRIFEEGLCLPSGSAMSTTDLERTIQRIRAVL